MRLSGLLGLDVVTESGWSYGKVFDVRVAADGDRPEVLGLVVGGRGLAERLFGERRSRPGEVTHAFPVIRWRDVLRVQQGSVVVREGARPDESEPSEEAR